MAKVRAALQSFNRGEISKFALARVDVERMRLSAEEQINWAPWVLGPMMLRPGLQYCGEVRNDAPCRIIPFIFSNDDTALLILTDSAMRIWTVSGDTETAVTRPAVSTTITNGTFSSSAGWTLTATGSGAISAISNGLLQMASPVAGGLAQAKIAITVAPADRNVRHGFRILVTRGPVRFRAGTADGLDDYVSETTLDTGEHSLSFIPTAGTVYLQVETITAQLKLIESITIDTSGPLDISTPWTVDDLPYLRFSQSGDIIFVACQGKQQRKIERRGVNSWSVVTYKSDDGPFQGSNATDITFTPAAISGNTTLTASRDYFRPSHAGALFRLFSSGQTTNDSVAGDEEFGAAIRVTGVGTDRTFNLAITGTWSASIVLQRSLLSESAGFTDVEAFTSNDTKPYTDGLDNSIIWYRLGIRAGNYTSGTAVLALTYGGGGAAGIARVTNYLSRTVVNVEVLTAFSSLTPTTDWSEGDWSDLVGWPSAVRFHDGRLWFAGRDRIWGSVSDAYYSFNIDTIGDAGPINRSVGFGPVDRIEWLLDLSRLIVGRQGAETSVRSGSFDQPLSPTNFTLKDCSTQGSAPIAAVKIDTRGVFVQQSNRRAFELGFSVESQDYNPHDLTRLNPNIGSEGFVDLAVQRQPDTQLHFIRGDGQVAALLHDTEDSVEAWWRIDTDCGVDGEVENVAVLPGHLENRVYYIVKRTIDGGVRRYFEKAARRDQCYGLPEARLADSHAIYSGSATTTISGLDHLEGEQVVVWGWNTVTPFTATLPDGSTQIVGRDFGTFSVSGGQITGLASAVTDACVGLGYSATFKSAKLAYAAQMGTALNQKKKVDRVGLILANTHNQGLEYGQSFATMDAMPLVESGEILGTNIVWEDYDEPLITVPGEWDTDARLHLRATAPRPCMVLAAVVDITTHE